VTVIAGRRRRALRAAASADGVEHLELTATFWQGSLHHLALQEQSTEQSMESLRWSRVGGLEVQEMEQSMKL
jgi:hypothetical protein